jgi:phosphate transport system substrate-binding protein
VDGLTPEAANYPYQRTLYYAYKQPPSPQAQAFLGYATSPQGQQALSTPNQ